MSSTLHDPRILYSINNIRAFHLQNGEESELTSSGPQTLSLLMVPTASPYQDATGEEPGTPEEDFYLHLHLPPELDMPLPATTQIYHQPPDSYLIPRWDLGPDAGAFIRLKFPGIGPGPDKVTQEDVDTFETILAQCTAFLERATAPQKGHAAYNPADYAPGEGYVSSPDAKANNAMGQIVLVDEEDGSVVGELSDGYQVVEQAGVKPGSKSMLLYCPSVWHFLTHSVCRSRRNPASSRRGRESNQHWECVRRIPPHGSPSGLQEFDHCANIGDSISPHRDRDIVSRQCAHQRSRQFHPEDETESQASDVHAGRTGADSQDQQSVSIRRWALYQDRGSDWSSGAEYRRDIGTAHRERETTAEGI